MNISAEYNLPLPFLIGVSVLLSIEIHAVVGHRQRRQRLGKHNICIKISDQNLSPTVILTHPHRAANHILSIFFQQILYIWSEKPIKTYTPNRIQKMGKWMKETEGKRDEEETWVVRLSIRATMVCCANLAIKREKENGDELYLKSMTDGFIGAINRKMSVQSLMVMKMLMKI